MLGTIHLENLEFGLSPENFDLLRKANIRYIRYPLSFPFVDKNMTQLSDVYLKELEVIRKLKSEGFETLAATNCAASYRFNDGNGKVECVRELPDWVGEFDQDEFYERMNKVLKYMASETKGLIEWWQVANEPDIKIFYGNMTHAQNERYLRACAAGLREGNPDAKVGINLAGDGFYFSTGLNNASAEPYGPKLVKTLYNGDGLFDYLGIDGYFGSWAKGGPEDWIPYIDKVHEISKAPIIIVEWGYSTLQRGEPRTAQDRERYYNSNVCLEKDWDAGDGEKWLGKDHCEELQADYIKQCAMIFAEHPAVIGNFFFRWDDPLTCWQCGAPDCPAEVAWGCIRVDCTPKPGYFALVEAYNNYFNE